MKSRKSDSSSIDAASIYADRVSKSDSSSIIALNTLVSAGDPDSSSIDATNTIVSPMPVRWKRLHEKAALTRMTKGAACYDMTACAVDCHSQLGKVIYKLGVALEIPEGYVGLIFPRSSCHKLGHQLTNSVGVIDSDYRGEVSAVFTTSGRVYEAGERCCQLMVIQLPGVELVEAEDLTDTERGQGGFGSTGK